ncbi:MAG: polysaccharide biosynthesis C-terminal domain-containing protein [Spirulinaceae cyanobacterium]
MGWCTGVNIMLNLIGIPWLGILGAGIATAVSMALWNIWLHRLVVRYLNINPSIVAALGR